jgi:hypothetical protein
MPFYYTGLDGKEKRENAEVDGASSFAGGDLFEAMSVTSDREIY